MSKLVALPGQLVEQLQSQAAAAPGRLRDSVQAAADGAKAEYSRRLDNLVEAVTSFPGRVGSAITGRIEGAVDEAQAKAGDARRRRDALRREVDADLEKLKKTFSGE